MKRNVIAIVGLAACLLAVPAAAPAASGDMAALFPELEGWQKKGGTETYVPDNLYEYIDGAAENFLAYGFRWLAVQNFKDEAGRSISAEIYFHGTAENAFGIYGSEKPLAGSYLAIGSQGYGEEGILNFISDAYYVKLSGFDLGPAGDTTLRSLAERIVAAIHGRNGLPTILAVFPAKDKLANSERFILRNFLGHEFLSSAYTADYEGQERKFKLFVIRTGGEDASRAILRRYAALDKSTAARKITSGPLTILDPYNGPVRVSWQGEFLWGALGPAPDEWLAEMGRNLEKLR
jgi:hypothetical protein